MPNYCDSCFKVTGDDESLVMRFYMDMAKACGGFGGLTKEERAYKNSDGKDAVTGDDWYGNIYLAAGYTMKEIEAREMHARGWETEVELEHVSGKPVVKIAACMAWNPAIDEMYQMINEKYGGALTVYYWAEEPGNELYLCNDGSGLYFSDRYAIDYDTGRGDADRIYFSAGQEEDAVRLVGELTGRKYTSMAEILANENEVSDAFMSEHDADDAFISIHEFTEY